MFGVHVDHASSSPRAAGHPVYRYHFRAEPASPDQTIGAFHAADVFYVFDTSLPLVPTPDDAHLLSATWVTDGSRSPQRASPTHRVAHRGPCTTRRRRGR